MAMGVAGVVRVIWERQNWDPGKQKGRPKSRRANKWLRCLAGANVIAPKSPILGAGRSSWEAVRLPGRFFIIWAEGHVAEMRWCLREQALSSGRGPGEGREDAWPAWPLSPVAPWASRKLGLWAFPGLRFSICDWCLEWMISKASQF